MAWSRILKDKGEIIITDFHPDILASGGKRTFRHQRSSIAVKNFLKPKPGRSPTTCFRRLKAGPTM